MIWLVLAGGLVIAELLTLTFVLGLGSAAALLTVVAALLGVPVAGQVAVFGVANAALFLLVRPFERRHRAAPALVTGTAALVGRQGLVTAEVTAESGRVKLGGESWAARSWAPGLTLRVGTHVSVQNVDGATLVVYPEEL